MTHAPVALGKNISSVMARSIKIHAVLGIIFNSEQEVLIAQRLPDKPLSGLWEFPGGKVELSETSAQALNREMQEEIGIEVLAAKFLLQVNYDYPDRSVQLDAWEITDFSGEPHGKEGQPVQWLKVHELKNWPFPPANKAIVEAVIQLGSIRSRKSSSQML
jgi:8-oxo-dGTP diphosphatase